MIGQGEIWWADLEVPAASEPRFRRPVVVVQCEAFNRSRIATDICAILTSNMRWAEAPGNVVVPSSMSKLPKDSVVNVAQLVTLDKTALSERAGGLPRPKLDLVLEGIRTALGL